MVTHTDSSGVMLEAQPGCYFETLPLGAASVLAEVERQEDNGVAHPVIWSVFINGRWCDADVVHPMILSMWIEALTEDMRRPA
jgi:hypothetical protein